MRFFYDCEFIEDGKTIDLISIGIVAEDGRELYCQSVEFDASKASDWVKDNVIEQLVRCPYFYYENEWTRHQDIGGFCHQPKCPWRSREQIEREILTFMDPLRYGKPELWGYYSAYDHVVFCQLFGTMMDLPKAYPMYTRDIKQWCDALGNPLLPRQGKDEHNALADAKHNYVMWKFLDAWAKTKLIG